MWSVLGPDYLRQVYRLFPQLEVFISSQIIIDHSWLNLKKILCDN